MFNSGYKYPQSFSAFRISISPYLVSRQTRVLTLLHFSRFKIYSKQQERPKHIPLTQLPTSMPSFNIFSSSKKEDPKNDVQKEEDAAAAARAKVLKELEIENGRLRLKNASLHHELMEVHRENYNAARRVDTTRALFNSTLGTLMVVDQQVEAAFDVKEIKQAVEKNADVKPVDKTIAVEWLKATQVERTGIRANLKQCIDALEKHLQKTK
ncbi:uncharacterized protein B0J16DRAFT_36165 [Fusarium flagelliforme]|uniref:uncharacterized protein n=1 Tax=Fusarium flagelliforme TaxID=2675880 RepID=UPI001E8E8AF6|nr:uncharacterized protein B0J16DRAFT_36165 [Fusarium flagelliforme]KAH7198204.1 hypothetical protein B0J16DRAFT_36165 [Fusarium flagelliforme]